MSHRHAAVCRSGPWRAVTRRVVLPWALQGFEPHGDVLEVGAGSGAMAAELLARYPQPRLTVTDFDPAMVDAAGSRLARFGARVTLRQADATALPFPDDSFDAVLSWIMLHHTVEWEQAVAECVRVLRPGGHLVGYDLLKTPPLRMLHRDGPDQRLVSLAELRALVGGLPVAEAVVTPGLGGLVVRFRLRKRPG
jgi:ubiquinone/menaquinone biosynthesis C-methylase UbiE